MAAPFSPSFRKSADLSATAHNLTHSARYSRVRKKFRFEILFLRLLFVFVAGREHLRLYARLRDEDSVRRVADWGLKKLGLLPYADRAAGTYSGGNKRKLQTAIALVGNPSIVFLDEPTTGMDPGARRFLWNCILEMIRGGQSVVLTSHSMEECEALCTRLGIMVNGRFQCLGSAQHLKNRFGSGYTLTLRSTGEPPAIATLKEMILKLFPLAELKEEHYNQLQYQLPLKHTRLPIVFREMERAKAKASESMLEDYTITQTTLDEVRLLLSGSSFRNLLLISSANACYKNNVGTFIF